MDNEDDAKSSFHGRLSHFAYMPSPPSFSARRPTFDTGAQSQNGARSPDGLDIIDDSSPGSSLGPVKVVASQKRKGRETRSLSPKKQRVGYVAPDVYAHLQGVQDHVAEDLDVLFCGINPGHMSAAQGHHYANPTNHFWRCLFLSGFTPRRLLASEDSTLPEAYNLGLTNLVERPSASQAELSNREMADSAPALLAKVARLRPRVVCFIGKGIWLRVERSLLQRTRNNSEDRPGFRGGPGARATEATSAVLKKEEMGDQNLTEGGLVDGDGDGDRRPAQAEPELATFGGANSLMPVAKTDDLRSVDPLALIKVEGCLDTVPVPSPSAMTTGRGNVAAPRAIPWKVVAGSGFEYGLQPYKAVHHDVEPNNESVNETLFCVFPSTSGRVVSHQLGDKVALFKLLRENLEHIKAGTLDTSSMRLVRL